MKTPTLIVAALVLCSIGLQAQENFKTRQLTAKPAREGFPTFSPDGKYIICQQTDMNDTSGQNGLWKIPLKNVSGAKQIYSGVAEHPRWSPDATQIAFVEGSSIALCVFNSRTGDLTSLYSNEGMLPLPGGWTSDGAYILTALMERESRLQDIMKTSIATWHFHPMVHCLYMQL